MATKNLNQFCNKYNYTYNGKNYKNFHMATHNINNNTIYATSIEALKKLIKKYS